MPKRIADASRLAALAIAFLILGLVRGADAATVALVPTSNVDGVVAGDFVSFDIFMDFSDTPAGTIGGGFDIVFDASALRLVGFVRDPGVGLPDFSRDPDVSRGLLESWAVGDFNLLPDTAQLGSVRFRVLPTMGASTDVFGRETNGIGGPWIDASTLVDVLPVTYNTVTITQVPEPASGTLLALGLGMLASVVRRSERAARRA